MIHQQAGLAVVRFRELGPSHNHSCARETRRFEAIRRAGTSLRQHAHVEDRIRDKDTGLAKFPFKEFALNEV
jgi:hypothetical protein